MKSALPCCSRPTYASLQIKRAVPTSSLNTSRQLKRLDVPHPLALPSRAEAASLHEPHLPATLLASLFLYASSLGCVVEPAAAVAQPTKYIEGPARVVDGDTLVVNGEKIRLFGLDAPEKAQPCRGSNGSEYACGLVSRDALTAKLADKPVKCAVKTVDQYGRNVASCSDAGGQDVGDWLVSEGHAVAYRQYSKQYVPLEDAAHAAHKGIWVGSFEVPAEWRKSLKAGTATSLASTSLAVAAPATDSDPVSSAASAIAALFAPLTGGGAPPALCLQPAIKGNISGATKEKIYHVPGGKQYNQVKIDLDAGERFFCTEQEAQAAGWRRAQ